MNEKAKEILSDIEDKKYSQWDFICLACIILIGAAELLPIKTATKYIVGTIIDGEISHKKLENGILSIKSK